MPIGYPTSPFPFVEEAMLLARSLVNDTFPGATATPGEGQILTDSSTISPFTIPFINSAIRRVYRKLGNQGVASLIQDNYILTGLSAVFGANGSGAADPATQVSITTAGYWNGNSLDTSNKLPANCLAVLKMWERINGSGNPFGEMVQALFGLPSRNQTMYLGDWEWRGGSNNGVPPTAATYGDGVYMCGCLQATDVRLRMSVSLPSQVSGNGTDFATLQIPVMDSTDAVANYIAAFYTAARGEDDPEVLGRSKILMEAGDGYTMELANRQIRQKQAVPYQRQPYGNSGWGGTGWF
jgi:hypothetical protein